MAFYASELNMSPTLSNLFSNYFNRSPLGVIHDRIVIHGRRQINYTDIEDTEVPTTTEL